MLVCVCMCSSTEGMINYVEACITNQTSLTGFQSLYMALAIDITDR